MNSSNFSQLGIRISLEAESLLNSRQDKEDIVKRLLNSGKVFVDLTDIENEIAGTPDLIRNTDVQDSQELQPVSLNNPSNSNTEVRSQDFFHPAAKEYSSDFKIVHSREVTGKSRTTGSADDFVAYFRNRYERLARILRLGRSNLPLIDLVNIKKFVNQEVRVIVMVIEVAKTKKGNILVTAEDLSGSFKIVFSHGGQGRDNEKLFENAGRILVDDVISISGKVLEPYIIAKEFEWPDIPITHQRKFAENDVSAVYLSDIHFGSRYFLDKYFELFVDWLQGKGEASDIAGKVKYIFISGDIVDGIGIYPNQEKELIIKDVFKQYELFRDFVEQVPDYIEIFVCPGNHDAVRRGEPMPALGKEFVGDRVNSLGNPSTLIVEGVKHVMYHGTSIDSLIATLPNCSYNHPEKVMVEYLRRRHLSTIYGGNPIVPEKVDYMVLEEEPDVLHCGHVHKNGYTQYRGTLLINSGTFQDRTEFQIKQGHVPTPCLIPVCDLKTGKLRTLDFKSS
ncbi:TPA: DNA-directed DNA polymerase II small subunit [Candidatus Micrarchaeota archaeon]|nr:DNA-directed DNA polymerase II small subunit [Candidatus Micrarchaeota archaeon]